MQRAGRQDLGLAQGTSSALPIRSFASDRARSQHRRCIMRETTPRIENFPQLELSVPSTPPSFSFPLLRLTNGKWPASITRGALSHPPFPNAFSTSSQSSWGSVIEDCASAFLYLICMTSRADKSYHPPKREQLIPSITPGTPEKKPKVRGRVTISLGTRTPEEATRARKRSR